MIEQRIEELAVTINELTTSLNILIKMAQEGQHQQTQAPEPVKEEPTPSSATPITEEQLKEEFLKLNRIDPKNKPRLKKLLKDHGATRVSDLGNTDDIVIVYNKLINGEY